MVETFEERGIWEDGVRTLQPVLQPLTPNGRRTDERSPVCLCGAPAHETNRNICAKGHARRGNALAKKGDDAPNESPVHALFEKPAMDSVAEAERLVVVLNAEIAKLWRRRQPSARELTMLCSQLLKTREFLDARSRPMTASETERKAFLRSLPDDLLSAFVAFAEGERYELTPRYATEQTGLRALSAQTQNPAVGVPGEAPGIQPGPAVQLTEPPSLNRALP